MISNGDQKRRSDEDRRKKSDRRNGSDRRLDGNDELAVIEDLNGSIRVTFSQPKKPASILKYPARPT